MPPRRNGSGTFEPDGVKWYDKTCCVNIQGNGATMAGNRKRGNRKNSKKWRRKKADHLIRVLLAAMIATVVFAIVTIAVSHLLSRGGKAGDPADSSVANRYVSGRQVTDAAEGLTLETEAVTSPEEPVPGNPSVPVEQIEATEQASLPEQTGQAAQADSGTSAAPVVTGRVIFVGDSRTIDMFADSDDPLDGAVHDGIIVHARHGHAVDYFKSVMENVKPVAGDMVVSFMGANDRGAFGPYGEIYNSLLAQGVKLVVCTIGPCATGAGYGNQYYDAYHNIKMTTFNEQLVPWANTNGVPVIDTYSYIWNNIKIDPDGIHYLPRPTTALWQYILDSLKGIGAIEASVYAVRAAA